MTIPFFDLGLMHQEIGEDLEQAWRSVVLDSEFIGGHQVDHFEEEWADYCSTRYSVGVGNGTDALQLSLRAMNIGPGDEVIVPANSFVATAAAVILSGATPHFVDVDPDTLLLSDPILRSAINPRTACVMVVHLYGAMPDMDSMRRIATRHGLALIEDAAQAHGAAWRGGKAGSFGDVGCFSFYPGKNLGAFGDAGAVVTNDASLAERVRSLGNHGRVAEDKHSHISVGTNSRLDSLQAAVLSAKLRRLDRWNDARRSVMKGYRQRLEDTLARPVHVLGNTTSACHLNPVRVHARDALRARLKRRGIATGVHYPIPCHRQAAFQGFARERLPIVEEAAKELVSLPLFPHMTPTQVETTCAAVTEILSRQVERVS
jgi:dTDP-4-amino-4,6-dideoxygalactose transaminase